MKKISYALVFTVVLILLSACNGDIETSIDVAETTTVPTETTTVPAETTTVPVETTTVPVETTTVPVETTTVPVETTTVPEQPTTPIEYQLYNDGVISFEYPEGWEKKDVSNFIVLLCDTEDTADNITITVEPKNNIYSSMTESQFRTMYEDSYAAFGITDYHISDLVVTNLRNKNEVGVICVTMLTSLQGITITQIQYIFDVGEYTYSITISVNGYITENSFGQVVFDTLKTNEPVKDNTEYGVYDDGYLKFSYPTEWVIVIDEFGDLWIEDKNKGNYISVSCEPASYVYILESAGGYATSLSEYYKEEGFAITETSMTKKKNPNGLDVIEISLVATDGKEIIYDTNYWITIDYRAYAINVMDFYSDDTSATLVFETADVSVSDTTSSSSEGNKFDFGYISFDCPDIVQEIDEGYGSFSLKGEDFVVYIDIYYDTEKSEVVASYKEMILEDGGLRSALVQNEEVNSNGINAITLTCDIGIDENSDSSVFYTCIYFFHVDDYVFVIMVGELDRDMPISKTLFESLKRSDPFEKIG